MSVDSSQMYEPPYDKFQSLQLSIPFDSSQFNYIEEFLNNLLNLSDLTKILQSDDIHGDYYDVDSSCEILPGISLPNDIWLRSNINVKDIKIKITMLTELNTMIDKELEKSQELDDTLLMYYQKILVAYKFYELPVRNSFSNLANTSHNSLDLSVKEELDEELEDYDDSKSLNRTMSNQSSNISRHSYFSHSSNNNVSSSSTQSNNYNYNNLNSSNGKRNSSSRENLLSRKRFSSIMGNNNGTNNGGNNTNNNGGNTNGNTNYNINDNGNINTNTNTNTLSRGNTINSVNSTNNGEIDDEDDHRKSFNSILSKSKIYNRMKKNRELTSSLTSNSNRNSISTSVTTNSNNSKVKRNSQGLIDNDLKFQPFHNIPIFATYSLNQRQEIQKNKFEYYAQIKQLVLFVSKIIKHLHGNTTRNEKNYKLIDFIKRYIFKFIVLDTSEMVNSYGEVEAYRLYNRLNKS